MKKIISTAIFLAIIPFAKAQDSDPVKIQVLKDEVETLTMYRVSIPIWNLNLSNYNMSAYDAVLGFHAQPSSKLYFHANYSISLFERLFPDLLEASNPSVMSAVSINKDTHSNSFNVEGTYFFHENIRVEDIRISLKSHTMGRTTVETVTYVPGKIQTRFGFRAGFTKGVTWLGIDDVSLTGVGSNGSEYMMEFQDKSTYLQYSQLRLGFARTKTTNLHVNAEGYGYRSNAGINYLYADAIIAMNQELEDVLAAYYFDGQGKMYYRRYEIDSKTPKTKIGFALGFRSLPISSAGSFSAEAGLFTGVKKEGNGYLKLGFNLLFGTSEKVKNVNNTSNSK